MHCISIGWIWSLHWNGVVLKDWLTAYQSIHRHRHSTGMYLAFPLSFRQLQYASSVRISSLIHQSIIYNYK